jgi:sucrose phosphorylase
VRLALETKVKRDVNRPALDYEYLIRALAEPGSKVNLVSEHLRHLFRIRTLHAAFHPSGPQRVLSLSPSLFSLLRTSPDGESHVICIINITNRQIEAAVDVAELGFDCLSWFDLLGGRGWQTSSGNLRLEVAAYEVLWLAPFHELEKQIEDAG